MEKYNSLGAVKLPVGTEVMAVNKGNMRYIVTYDGKQGAKRLLLRGTKDGFLELTSRTADTEFVKVPSVYFKEALDSGKKVRIDLSYYINIETAGNCLLDTVLEKYNSGRYLTIKEILMLFSVIYTEEELRVILSDKCWLMEGEN